LSCTKIEGGSHVGVWSSARISEKGGTKAAVQRVVAETSNEGKEQKREKKNELEVVAAIMVGLGKGKIVKEPMRRAVGGGEG